jgi:hypothetical protein
MPAVFTCHPSVGFADGAVAAVREALRALSPTRLPASWVALSACALLLTACTPLDLVVHPTELEETLAPDASALDEELAHGELDSISDPDDLYAPERLPTFKITLDPEAEAKLGDKPREYVPAKLELIDGDTSEVLEEVGLKLKGVGSFRTLAAKAAFRIKLDKYRKHKLRGLKALTLNNSLQDSSLMAERVSYYIFRQFSVPASKANHALVYVNDVYYGVYVNIETPNEELLAHWFENPHRNLYEQDHRDFDKAESFELETNEKQPDDREHLHALQEACIANDLGRARELVDWPKFLLFEAIEAAVNQVDGYGYATNYPNNYRIYDSDTGFVFIPSGLDWTLGRVGTQDESLFVDPFWVRKTHGVLLRMCLADESCTNEYRDVLQMVASRWDDLALEQRTTEYARQIDEGLVADTRRERTVERAWASQDLRRAFVRLRAQTLREALDRQAAGLPPGNADADADADADATK